MFELTVEDTFDAAHQLRGYEGPCENLHGHTWKVRATFSGGKLNKLGMLVDFKEIKAALKEVLSAFDHRNLNDLSAFKRTNPTSENVAVLIFKGLSGKMGGKAKLKKVTVFESPVTSASYARERMA